MKISKLRNGDKIIMAFIIGTGCLIGIFCLFFGQTGDYVNVSVDGKNIARFSLNVDRLYDIDGHNKLEIKDGYANMIDANCPDGLCVKMGKINKNGQSIICLPNKTVIEVVSDSKSNDVDVIVQ